MGNKRFNFNNYFQCFSLLKVKSPYQSKLIIRLHDALINYYSASVYKNLILGPYAIFGQYDILYGLPGETPSEVSRTFYAILDMLYDSCPSMIRDYYKTLNFEWIIKPTLDIDQDLRLNEYAPTANDSCLAYITLKYKNPIERSQFNSVAAYEVISTIIRRIKELDDLYKINIGDLKFRLFGSMSWSEIMLFCYGNNYESINKLCAIFSMTKDAVIKRWTYVWDSNKYTFEFPIDCIISTQIVPASALYSKEFDDLKTAEKTFNNKYIMWSGNHAILSYYPNKLSDFNEFWDSIQKLPGIEYTNSTFYYRFNEIADENICAMVKCSERTENQIMNEFAADDIKVYLEKIESQNIPRRKLKALQAELKIILQNKEYTNIFPENVTNAIDLLIDNADDYSDETVQYFISEFTAAVRDRLAGSQLDIIIGKDVGFLEDHQSYTRLIFACEGLIMRCLSIYLKQNKTMLNQKNKPVILPFFDYGSRLSNEMPPEIMKQGLKQNLPIAIRLNMSRYKPWLWVLGLNEIAKLTFLYTRQILVNEIITADPTVKQHCDIFLRSIFIRETMSKIIQDQIGYVHKIKKNKYCVSLDLADEVRNRLDRLDDAGIVENYFVDDMFDKIEMEKYMAMLKNGEIVYNLNDAQFINYINAYMALPRNTQNQASAFISYVISLYWDYWRERKKVNEAQ